MRTYFLSVFGSHVCMLCHCGMPENEVATNCSSMGSDSAAPISASMFVIASATMHRRAYTVTLDTRGCSLVCGVILAQPCCALKYPPLVAQAALCSIPTGTVRDDKSGTSSQTGNGLPPIVCF